MMNKNIFSRLIMRGFNVVFPMSAGIILFFSSCDDLLKEEPRAVTEENFYNTAAEVETAVNAIYSPLRSENQTTYIATLECHTDYGYGRGSFAQYNDFQGMNSNNINRVAGFWNAFYLSIRNANIVIKNAPEGDAISPEDVDKYVSEARFLRALSYFHLVRNWGDIPLRTEENMENVELAKSSKEEVYDFILAEQLEADTNLRDV